MRSCVWASFGAILVGCSSEPEVASVAQRYEEALESTQTWCVEAQLELAGLAGTAIDATAIESTMYEDELEFTKSKSSIDASADVPVQIRARTLEVEGHTAEIHCKLRSQDAIEAVLGVEATSPEQPCRAMNERALLWAFERLSDEERERFEAEGRAITTIEDVMSSHGGRWTTTDSTFVASEDGVEVAASAMLLEYADYPDLSLDFRGVHYCKLMSPELALWWMLELAFEPEAETRLERPMPAVECPHPQPGSAGSCIFYFETSQQHFCEEYTGPGWTLESAQVACDDRAGSEPSMFSPMPCSERAEETRVLDDDGVHRGACYLSCGMTEEYVWHVYSEPSIGGDFSAFCAGETRAWIPSETD